MHKPREVALRQPLTHVGRHQKRLLAITRDEALAHHRNRLKPAGRHPTYATASRRKRNPDDAPARRLLVVQSGRHWRLHADAPFAAFRALWIPADRARDEPLAVEGRGGVARVVRELG